MLSITPVEKTDAEYKRIVAISNAIYPDNLSTVAVWKHDDVARDPKYLFKRFVFVQEGTIVGFGSYGDSWWAHQPGKYFFKCDVHPDFQGQGTGTAFYDYAVSFFLQHKAKKVVVAVREDKTQSVRFLSNRGFCKMMRFPTSYLDVDAFEFNEYRSLFDKLEAQNVKIYAGGEFEDLEPNWKQKMCDLSNEIIKDLPSPDPITPQSFEQFEKEFLQRPNFCLEANFIAVGNGEFVGLSNLWTSEAEPEKLYTGLSGVLPSYRRKGICTAMKVRGFEFAKRYGAKRIETENEENNPMYQLNLDLGFKPQPAWMDYTKHFEPLE